VRLLRTLLFVALFVAGAVASNAGTAAAYGNSGGKVQTYQLTFSFNCNAPAVCGPELGGFWGWAVLYSDGTGEAELTGCGHVRNGGGPGTAGAGHFHSDFTWIISSGQIVLTSETDVFLGHGTPVTVTTPIEFMPVAPAAPGHYSTADVFGFTYPGVAVQIQVVQLHT
jgi:hypothetical protein